MSARFEGEPLLSSTEETVSFKVVNLGSSARNVVSHAMLMSTLSKSRFLRDAGQLEGSAGLVKVARESVSLFSSVKLRTKGISSSNIS